MARIKRLFGGDDGNDIGVDAAIYGEMTGNSKNGGKNGNGRNGAEADNAAAAHERMLIQNVLALRDLSAEDCMVPRVDINAIEVDTPQSDLLKLLANKTHSRMPVYRESLDEVVGVLHIRDVLAALAAGKPLVLTDLVRNPMIVAPSMPVMDLLLEMRMKQTHLALVVDEFGGIDGLVTIEDLVEQIVGEIRDEHETDEAPQLVEQPDGTLIVDARLDIDDFEAHVGHLLTEEEREDIDTLGGLVFALAGEVPNRGALIPHSSGLEFEVLECDPRRIRRLRVHHYRTAGRTDEGQGATVTGASNQS
ncbi:MAG: HlyC/CorC family transporter [Alphaproteobacteria bacterium]|nr:HlyC/CorC family transporter [Alphaproteobacteria bacterium SS10]